MLSVIALVLVGAAIGPVRSFDSRAQPAFAQAGPAAQQVERYLYVALPGSDRVDPDRSVRILVFDIARNHRFVRRIPVWPAGVGGDAEVVRGAAASARAGRLFISTTSRLAAIDLKTERIVWERRYDSRCCDRLAVSPDGQTIYAPAFGSPKWYVIAAATGDLRAAIAVTGWPRETIYARDGKHAYLAAWESVMLSISDTTSHAIVKEVGPFSASLCAFALNAAGTLAFANVDGLVGFEVGDLQTGLILDRVAAEGYDARAAADYECPSHGIAFTPDQRELWVADGVQNRLQVFDASVYPPVARTTVDLPAQPRWIAFSIDGRYAYVSTGDVIGAADRKIIGALEDAAGAKVVSEHFVEIDFVERRPVRTAERSPMSRMLYERGDDARRR
jgi:DNA-binding beta-propeller fold protein YncE